MFLIVIPLCCAISCTKHNFSCNIINELYDQPGLYFNSDLWKTHFFQFSRIVNETTPEIIYGLERYIHTECVHTMTEGICYVFDSLQLASVINSAFLMNFLVF